MKTYLRHKNPYWIQQQHKVQQHVSYMRAMTGVISEQCVS